MLAREHQILQPLIVSLTGSNFVYAVQSVKGIIAGWGRNKKNTAPGDTLKVILFYFSMAHSPSESEPFKYSDVCVPAFRF